MMWKSYLLPVVVSTAMIGAGCASHMGRASSPMPPAGPVYAGAAAPGVVPAGTELVLRTDETINTDRAASGRVYDAEVERAIVDVRGRTLVPDHSRAQLFVVDSTGGGTVGTASLELAVRSITIGGRTYPVMTEVQERQAGQRGLGANQRTAEMVGGGALLGTVIGAIAGGGTGAAIGAAAGAAGGATVQVLTKGKRITVPAETLLTFRLDRPVRLVGYGS
jgi:hypothetical protein